MRAEPCCCSSIGGWDRSSDHAEEVAVEAARVHQHREPPGQDPGPAAHGEPPAPAPAPLWESSPTCLSDDAPAPLWGSSLSDPTRVFLAPAQGPTRRRLENSPSCPECTEVASFRTRKVCCMCYVAETCAPRPCSPPRPSIAPIATALIVRGAAAQGHRLDRLREPAPPGGGLVREAGDEARLPPREPPGALGPPSAPPRRPPCSV